jgi:hypothetical protein
MAVRALPRNHVTVIKAVEEKSVRLVSGNKPRRCMVVSSGLVLAGLSIPLLMAVGVFPLSFVLGFLGFGLAGTGGVLLLIFCGEL